MMRVGSQAVLIWGPPAEPFFFLESGFAFWVYILQNPDAKFYIGQTDNLNLRLHSHNRTDVTFGKFTRKNGAWELVWSEAHSTCAEGSPPISSWDRALQIQ